MTDSDFVYKNPPLVEVIAEISWDLISIESIPGAYLDPHFSILEKEFKEKIKEKGYEFVEKIISENVPQEIIPWRPHYRFRKQSQKWPLFQIGPGIFTANMVPPYEGWRVFREILREGLNCLMDSYPMPKQFMTIRHMELRYLDAFTEDHGYENYRSFLKEDLGIVNEIRGKILEDHAADRDNVRFKSEVMFDIRKPINSFGIIRVTPGTKENKEAIISEFIVRKTKKPIEKDEKLIFQWFDESHFVVRDWFMSMVSDKLKERMGPSRPVNE